MADPKTVGTGPARQAGVLSRRERCDVLPSDEVGICGRTLFQRRLDAGEEVIRLYGGLDLSAAERLEEEQLLPAMQSAVEVCLDLTGLTEAQPEAVELFMERRRCAQSSGQRLAIRVSSAQVSEFFPESASADRATGPQ